MHSRLPLRKGVRIIWPWSTTGVVQRPTNVQPTMTPILPSLVTMTSNSVYLLFHLVEIHSQRHFLQLNFYASTQNYLAVAKENPKMSFINYLLSRA